MREVATTSLRWTLAHWYGFFSSGIRYVQNKLHYGMDGTHERFYKAVKSGEQKHLLYNMDGHAGLLVNQLQHDVVRLCS